MDESIEEKEKSKLKVVKRAIERSLICFRVRMMLTSLRCSVSNHFSLFPN